ncbi:Tnks2 [Symbiodinium sp. CCMP2592]|nr:Tnks2 [Symbiodinium sp. CCMP2592]
MASWFETTSSDLFLLVVPFAAIGIRCWEGTECPKRRKANKGTQRVVWQDVRYHLGHSRNRPSIESEEFPNEEFSEGQELFVRGLVVDPRPLSWKFRGKSRRFYDYTGRLAKGQALPIATIPQSFWEFGERYLCSGDYWGKQCQIVGVLECLTMGRGGIHAKLVLEGADNQDMLKWAEGLIQTGYPPEIAVHFCSADCSEAPVSTGGLHGQFVSCADTGVAWYGNVASIPRENNQGEIAKELSNLSKGRDVLGGIHPPGALAPTQENSGEDDVNRKTAGTTFKGTPLDKGITVRRWLRTRVKKKKSKKSHKKSRKRSPRIKQLARRVPGILTSHAVAEVECLLAQGVGDNQTVGLLSVMLRYLRLHVLRRDVAPGPKKELLTLAYTLDRLLQRDILGALDIIMQRVKSLQLVVGGSSWAVAQNLELVPLEQAIEHLARRSPGSDLLNILLRRGCGFADVVSNVCETSPTDTAEGRVKKECSVFPLPLPSDSDLMLVRSLSYLNGGIHVQLSSGLPTMMQSRTLDYLRERVEVSVGHEFSINRFDWSQFLQTRSVSYSGEEVAKWTSWDHVKPALPHGAIGSARATDFAQGVVLNLLRDPSPHVFGGWKEKHVKSSRVMVEDDDWGDLARGFIECGDLSTEMSPLVAAYADVGIPQNQKKSVKQAVSAEMQGPEVPEKGVVCIGLFDGAGGLRVALEALGANDVVRQDATAQSKPPVREDVVRKDVAPCAWAALLSGTWSSRGLAPTGEDAFGSMECLGSNLVLVIELIQIVVVVTEEAKAKEIFKKRKQNEMAKAANRSRRNQVDRHLSPGSRSPATPKQSPFEPRQLPVWGAQVGQPLVVPLGLDGDGDTRFGNELFDFKIAFVAADVKTAKAEQQSKMAKTKMIQANAILDVAFASSSGSQSAKKNAKGAAERILRELKSESEESSSSSSSKSPVQKKKKKQGRPAVDKKADKNKKGAKNVSKSRGRHR